MTSMFTRYLTGDVMQLGKPTETEIGVHMRMPLQTTIDRAYPERVVTVMQKMPPATIALLFVGPQDDSASLVIPEQ